MNSLSENSQKVSRAFQLNSFQPGLTELATRLEDETIEWIRPQRTRLINDSLRTLWRGSSSKNLTLFADAEICSFVHQSWAWIKNSGEDKWKRTISRRIADTRQRENIFMELVWTTKLSSDSVECYNFTLPQSELNQRVEVHTESDTLARSSTCGDESEWKPNLTQISWN